MSNATLWAPFAIRRSLALPVHVVLTVRVAGANEGADAQRIPIESR